MDREIARAEQRTTAHQERGPPRGSLEEQTTALKMAKEVFSKMDHKTLPGRFSGPTLWHRDLHLGNIYVDEDNPTEKVSIIDWQSTTISPLFCQVRFPEFLKNNNHYELGNDVLRLHDNFDRLNADDQGITRFKHKRASMAHAYEAASGSKNKNIYNALQLPSCFRNLVLRCGEVSEEGIVPLRACLIAIAGSWEEAGFKGRCPINFTEIDIEKHEQECNEYLAYHRIHELARESLDTDSEGWVSPHDDFEMKCKQNIELLQLIMDNSAEYGKTPQEIRRIWPFREGLDTVL